jgi:hypothetical protein
MNFYGRQDGNEFLLCLINGFILSTTFFDPICAKTVLLPKRDKQVFQAIFCAKIFKIDKFSSFCVY